jgi:hypothetical protein
MGTLRLGLAWELDWILTQPVDLQKVLADTMDLGGYKVAPTHL